MRNKNIIRVVGGLFLFMLLITTSAWSQEITTTNVEKVKIDSTLSVKEIVVAYGKQKASTLTSAISSVTSDQIEKASVVTAGSALYGKLAGLFVTQPGGQPGNSSPSYYIRGKGTTDNSTCLVLVDGIERSLDQIPVEDIASVSVLKDAAALALYGVKGANGVILVTTKRGFDGKTKITLNMEYGSQSPTRLPKFIGAADYAKYTNEARMNDNGGVANDRYSADEIAQFQNGGNPLYPNVNWFDQVLKSSTPIWKAGANFSGGNKIVHYFISANYLNNKGLYKYTDLNSNYDTNASYGKLNFRSNIDVNINKNLTASLDIAGHFEDRNYPGSSTSDIFNSMYTYLPLYFPMLNPNGTIGGNGVYQKNPYGLISSTGFTKQHDRNLQTRFKMNYKLDRLLKGLSAYGSVSFDNYVRYSDTKSKGFAVYSLSGTSDSLIYTKYGNATSLVSSSSVSQFNRWYTEGGFEFARQLGFHAISANILYQMGQYNNSEIFPYSQQGFAGRLHYDFASKYLAEFGWTVSGTDNAPKNKRFGFFPTLSAGWVLSKEKFMETIHGIDNLKIRASYGLTGNDLSNSGRFLYTTAYNTSASGYPFSDSNSGQPGLAEGIIANPNITWEKNYMANVGIDATLFKKLEITFDVFSNRRTDILTSMSYTIPEISGLSNGYVNYGQVTNKGFDGTITWSDQINKFGYFVSLNGCFAHSRVDKLGEPKYQDAYRSRVGKSVSQFYGYEAIGFFKDQAEIDASPKQFAPLKPGDVKYKDQNGDGIIDENDEIAIGGTSLPEFTYGANLGVSYAGFDISAQFEGAANRYVYLGSSVVGPIGSINQLPEIMDKRWTSGNSDNALYPRLTAAANTNNYRSNTIWLKPGDFLRLRMLEIGYQIPKKFIKGFGFAGLRVFARGMNIFTIDQLKFFDPEVQTGYPVMRSYNFGIKADF